MKWGETGGVKKNWRYKQLNIGAVGAACVASETGEFFEKIARIDNLIK